MTCRFVLSSTVCKTGRWETGDCDECKCRSGVEDVSESLGGISASKTLIHQASLKRFSGEDHMICNVS
jgi:hypothetical protein